MRRLAPPSGRRLLQLVEDERVDAASEENDAMRAHIHEHGSGGL
jgi:hypothetical protein